mgnify:FL=1
MENYGSDKPDLRFDMKFTDVTELVKDTDFKVFRSVIDNGGQVKAINVKGDATFPAANWTASSNTSATTVQKVSLGSASSKTAL